MKVLTWALVGVAGIFVIARLAGWCPGGSCSTGHSGTAAAVAATDPVAGIGATATMETPGFEPFEKAMADAKSQNKLVMVDVYTTWCHWCQKLDEDVYPTPEVQKQLGMYFAAVKVNAESDAAHSFAGKQVTERQLASQWNVTGYPTILFLSPDGTVLDRLPGYMPPKDFANVLQYMGTGAYKTTSFEAWQSAHS